MPQSLAAWETDLIIWIQSFRSPLLDQVFTLFTLMGEEGFFLLFLPAVFWSVNRQIGLRLGLVLLLNDLVNGVLKDFFAMTRPFDPRIAVLRDETSPAFPSGHAQNAVALWGYLASQFRRPLFWGMAVSLALLIGFSRIYLGVHFPHDVLGGWLAGVLVVVLFLGADSSIRSLNIRPVTALLLVLALPVALAVFLQSDGSYRVGGVLLGLGFGIILERELVGFEAGGGTGARIVRFLLGLVILAGLYLGLHAILPDTGIARFIRYAVLGLWVSLGAPWLFVRLGLAPVDRWR